jgi:hypothetical protein
MGLQLGQRFVSERLDLRHVGGLGLLLDLLDGFFSGLDLAGGISNDSPSATCGIRVLALSATSSRGATGKSSFLAIFAKCWLAVVRSLITMMV